LIGSGEQSRGSVEIADRLSALGYDCRATDIIEWISTVMADDDPLTPN
jgi:hypothetical protein